MGRHMQPGWYPDPEESSRYRWWSGTGWTPALTDDPAAAAPPPGLPQVAAGRSFPWVAVLVTVLILGIVVALTVIGAGSGRPLPGGAGESPSFGQAPTLREARSQRATVEGGAKQMSAFDGAVTMDVPTAPWKLSSSFCEKVVGLMLSGCLVYDESFTDFETSKTLQPVLLYGVMDPQFTLAAGATEIAGDLLEEWNGRAHRQPGVTADLGRPEPVADYPGHAAARAKGTARYELKGKQHVVEMTVLVIEIQPGGFLGVISMTDSLMKAQARTGLETSLKTLKLS